MTVAPTGRPESDTTPGTAGLIWGGFELPRNREVAEIGAVEVEARTT